MNKNPLPTMRVGIIGCGNICGIYFQNGKLFRDFDIVACADIDMERAQAKATEFSVPKACTVAEILADKSIDTILNLTVPKVHADIALQALKVGKNVYGEKPLAITREDGKKILELAKKKGLRVGSAPDTFMGAGIQTCKKIIDDGWIGTPIAVNAFMLSHGPERWHPNPDFFYQVGGGPLFDMGPYYLTALVALLGPIARVTGSAAISHPKRTINNLKSPRNGEQIKVEIPTHIAGVMDFACGAVGTLVTSFDVHACQVPRIEIYGSRGTISIPDPNTFGGPIKVFTPGSDGWKDVPFSHGYSENSRGIGLADMASAIKHKRAHRASGELAYHVLDIMHGFHDASRDGKHVMLKSSCVQPQGMPLGLAAGEVR